MKFTSYSPFPNTQKFTLPPDQPEDVLTVDVAGAALLDDDTVGASGLDPDGDAEAAGADDIGRGWDGHVGGGPVELERLAGEAGAVGRAAFERGIRGADRVLAAAVALPPGDQAGDREREDRQAGDGVVARIDGRAAGQRDERAGRPAGVEELGEIGIGRADDQRGRQTDVARDQVALAGGRALVHDVVSAGVLGHRHAIDDDIVAGVVGHDRVGQVEGGAGRVVEPRTVAGDGGRSTRPVGDRIAGNGQIDEIGRARVVDRAAEPGAGLARRARGAVAGAAGGVVAGEGVVGRSRAVRPRRCRSRRRRRCRRCRRVLPLTCPSPPRAASLMKALSVTVRTPPVAL